MSHGMVLIAGNSAYLIPLVVCVQSVVEQTPDLDLLILDCGLSRAERDLLTRTAGTAASLRFEAVVGHDLSALPEPACGSWSTYARLLVGDVGTDSGKVLYLDADT